MQKRVCLVRCCSACSTSSAKRLVAPMTFVGLTALSVDISTKVSTTDFERGFGGVPGADDVVVDAFNDVVLDDRHVLVGGGVIDRLHLEQADRTSRTRRRLSALPSSGTISISRFCLMRATCR